MTIKTKIHLLLLVAGGLGIYGCLKIQNVSPIPSIAFKNFVQYGMDSAALTITFQDGDGDVGLAVSDSAPPFNANSIYHHDIFLIYYNKGSDGLLHRYYSSLNPPGDSLEYDYNIPNVTPSGQNKAITGNIRVSLNFVPYWASQGGRPVDSTFCFKVYIYDRALHKSNVITTPPITVPSY